MVRPHHVEPQAVGTYDDDLPADHAPMIPGDGRDRLLDVLRARGLRFRDGARWRTAR